jgi:hypothetical protein
MKNLSMNVGSSAYKKNAKTLMARAFFVLFLFLFFVLLSSLSIGDCEKRIGVL